MSQTGASSTTTRRSDNFAIVPLAVTRDEKIYVLPYFRGRVDPFDGAQKIIEYYKLYRPRIVRVEGTGFQAMLKSYLLRSKDVDVRIPVVQENPPGTRRSGARGAASRSCSTTSDGATSTCSRR